VKGGSLPLWSGYPAAAALVAATIALLKLFGGLAESAVGLLLLLAVFLSAWIWQSGPGTFAAVLATLGYNFYFTEPRHTLTVADPRNVVALFVFLVSALLIGRLSALSRSRLRQVTSERRDLTSLTRLSEAFLADTNRETLLPVAADRLRAALQSDHVTILLADDRGELSVAGRTSEAPIRRDLAELAYRQGNSAAFPSQGPGTDIYLPIPVGVKRAGALVALGMQASERMAEGCAVLLGLAAERERFLRVAREAEKTRASDEMKSTLLAAVAHDLKTPVATARAAIENWRAHPGGSDARLAAEAIARLEKTIDQLMEVVRFDAGLARARLERVTCGEIVEAALSRFGEELHAHNLLVETPGGSTLVEVDPTQITEALGHGLENAARYSPAGSTVRVAAESDGDRTFLRVIDQGKGIPAADRERALERFVRLPGSGDVPGTGLGLAIARSLVRGNGGELTLGEAAGGGTVFEISLPRVVAE
jgi:two-component system sensor histidine kinase KdpD